LNKRYQRSGGDFAAEGERRSEVTQNSEAGFAAGAGVLCSYAAVHV